MIQRQLKLKLTVAQEKTLERWLWHLTGLYNWAIRKIELDARDRIFHTEFDLCAMLKGHSGRLGIPDHVLRGTINTAFLAWKRRFKGLSGRPRFKGNRNRLNHILLKRVCTKFNKVYLLGVLKFHKQEIPEGKVRCARIVKRASGWYLCLTIAADPKRVPITGHAEVGIDPGFNSLLTLSSGEIVEHPREFEASQRRLAQAQRGKNRRLTARLHERIGNQRKDRNHKLSRRLVAENKLIAFSADNHQGIAKKFGRSVASSGHAQLRKMITYKSLIDGRRYVEVNSKFSTQRCSSCGALSGPKGLSGLAVRRWTCGCGAEHDRDCNAAMNTLNVARGIRVERAA